LSKRGGFGLRAVEVQELVVETYGGSGGKISRTSKNPSKTWQEILRIDRKNEPERIKIS